MEKVTNEEKTIVNNLKFIGLDLENPPDFLLEYHDLNYKPTKAYDDNNFKVYKYLKISDIQILLTPTNRLNSLSEKYSKALHISNYLDTNNEENLVNSAKFLKMIENMNKDEIEHIEQEQIEFRNKVPFKVKYEDNYLWEIYFSEFTGKYFMMITTEDQDYSAMFYLIKKQIECKKSGKDEYIYVPICYEDYTKRYLKKSEISDLEKYIWIFTKHWPQIYEVFDKENELVMHVTGLTEVYDKIKSFYKLELKTKDDAVKFYQLLKALFILKTELPFFYDFEVLIGEEGELIFEYNSKIISFKMLSKFIKDEYRKHAQDLKYVFKEKEKLEKELIELKETERNKNLEYVFREKQVATYLECKNSIFGRIKYFFKGKNNKFRKKKEEKEEKSDIEVEKEISNNIIIEKDLYTIEDLINVCIEHNRIILKNKNIKQDIKAINEKIKRLEAKIKNATLFIDKIEEHRKSIFEFWKFTNKDETIGLNSGKEKTENKETKKLKRVFEYETDLEDYGIEIDRLQKKNMTKEECDAVFVAGTKIIDSLNTIKNNGQIKEDDFEKLKYELTKNNEIVYNESNFDIFGNVKEDKTKVSVLGNKSHRESKKDISKIIGMSPDMRKEDYSERILQLNKYINEALEKSQNNIDINIYTSMPDKLNTDNLEIFHIDPKNALEKSIEHEKINLYRITVPEKAKVIYYTNIMYYDNYNRTLPDGMNISDKVLFDMSLYKIELKRQRIFRINQDISETTSKPKIVCTYEYEVKL